MQKIGIIILAAGNSSRFGKPKQLLPYKSKTLLRHIIDEALKTLLPVAVILGSNKDEIENTLNYNGITIIQNKKWQDGIGTSIHAGIKHFENYNACIICLADQPFITTNIFLELINQNSISGKKIIASEYAETLGTPVLFDKIYFNKLKDLKRNEGAKKIIHQNIYDVAAIKFEKGFVDIDTVDEYENLISQNREKYIP